MYGTRRLPIFLFAFVVLIAIQATALAADNSASIGLFASKGFPDNADLRSRLFPYVIGASQGVALAYGEKQLQSSSAGPVTVRVEKRETDFVVEFINENSAVSGLPGRGSCFIQRSSAKGNYILQARILLQDDPACFLALYPSGSGTRGDVIMYGAVVKKGLYIPDLLYRILLLSFADIVDATSRSFDWSLVFRFDGRGAETLAELRAPGALAKTLPDQSAVGSVTVSQGAPAVGGSRGAGGKPSIALAAAPAFPSAAADALPKGPRSLRIAAAAERAASVDALIVDLGDMEAREVAPSPDPAASYLDSAESIGKLAYSDYPRYDSRGLSLSSMRAILYSDFLANPDSTYVLLGDGFHATVVPCFDDAGRLSFSCFAGGKETSWSEMSPGKTDLKVRAVRVPAGS